MKQVHQGEILRIQGIKSDVLVLSKDFFNQTGFAVVCPVLKYGRGALNIPVCVEGYTGTAHLENMKSIDLAARYFQTIAQLPYEEIQNISDAAQSIFDYYPY